MESSEENNRRMIAWGKDEMNLIELPFGPITPDGRKTFHVEHQVFDPILKRTVLRKTLITGSDAFGLPRPIDDQVLVGMKTLSAATGFPSPKVEFCVYQLCKILGWSADGRSYRRIEDSMNRIAGTTLQFKDAWYDQGEKAFKSKTFHLVDEIELRTQKSIERSRRSLRTASHPISYFVWNQVIWKSFKDGFIRDIDMALFRRIARGRRREVPIRLYRVLGKKFYKRSTVKYPLEHLAVGILGLGTNYSKSQLRRLVARAATWLIECGFIEEYWFHEIAGTRAGGVVFRRRRRRSRAGKQSSLAKSNATRRSPNLSAGTAGETRWFREQSASELSALEDAALQSDFGSDLEKEMIQRSRTSGEPITTAGPLRRGYIRRYFVSTKPTRQTGFDDGSIT